VREIVCVWHVGPEVVLVGSIREGFGIEYQFVADFAVHFGLGYPALSQFIEIFLEVQDVQLIDCLHDLLTVSLGWPYSGMTRKRDALAPLYSAGFSRVHPPHVTLHLPNLPKYLRYPAMNFSSIRITTRMLIAGH
jgi:hypothetical protein